MGLPLDKAGSCLESGGGVGETLRHVGFMEGTSYLTKNCSVLKKQRGNQQCPL